MRPAFHGDLPQLSPHARAREREHPYRYPEGPIRACHSSDWFREGGLSEAILLGGRTVAVIRRRKPSRSEKREPIEVRIQDRSRLGNAAINREALDA
jgi:hypothetical protein